MKRARTAFLGICIAVLLASPLQAKIYKSVLPDGTVVYSDTPPDGAAKEVELPPIQLYKSPPLPVASPAPAAADVKGYDTFVIASPEADATIRDNGGAVSVALTITPALQREHQVEIFVDGTSVGRGKGTSATLTDVDRGSHSVHATIVDGDGKEVARTPAVTFHIKRNFIRRKQPRGG